MFMPNSFSFKSVSENDICVINNIDSSKAYQKDNIPPSILQANVDIMNFADDNSLYNTNLSISKVIEN